MVTSRLGAAVVMGPIGCAHQGVGVDGTAEWRPAYDFWFWPGLDDAGVDVHRAMFGSWFGGGAGAELPRFRPVVDAATAGRLDHGLAAPLGRLSLIVVLDQFTRGLFAGTPEAYASDPAVLQVTETGLRNGHYDALTRPWERLPFALPLAHAEGPGHFDRLDRVVVLAEAVAHEAPPRLRPLYEHSANQARGHREVIAKFGRYPHCNAVLGTISTEDEAAYVAKGDFVHNRQPPPG